MVWAEEASGDYVNVAKATEAKATGSGSTWQVQVLTSQGSSVLTVTLAGTWASASDAQDAFRRLVDGVDPSTY